MRNPVGWFEIYVEDMERAKGFYEDVLQLKLEKLPVPDIEMWNFPMPVNAPGCAGSLVKMPGFPTGQNSVLVYFTCEDCSSEQSRVVGAGGRIEKEKFSIGQFGFVSLVYDTEGNMFGLHSMK